MGCGPSSKRKKKCKVALLGLDNAGKTTLKNYLVGEKASETIPTLSFECVSVRLHKLNFNIWDVGGQDALRPKWRHFFHGAEGVIFMVDSTDERRLILAKRELFDLQREIELQNTIILVFANKSDAQGAITPDKLSEALDLGSFRKGSSRVFRTVALTGEGVNEGFQWLSDQVRQARRTNKGGQVNV